MNREPLTWPKAWPRLRAGQESSWLPAAPEPQIWSPALADAMMDSVPLVAITGQVNKGLMGKDAFQEADIEGITMPVTKHNYQVKSPETLEPGA